MSIANIVRPDIRALGGYRVGGQATDAIRLNANEANWSDASDGSEQSLNRYPEIQPQIVQERLARFYGLPAESIAVTRGSSEAIDLLIRMFCRAGQDNILICPPTFEMYQVYADIQGIQALKAPLTSHEFSIDCDALTSACTPNTKLIFICSPNNPTGGIVPLSIIENLLDVRRDRSVVVVDEAYIEFSTAASAIELLDRFDNLVILRTTSKALALAGSRCGCAIANTRIIETLRSIVPPYSIPTPVVRHVLKALQPARLEIARGNIEATIALRDEFANRLAGMDIVARLWPSDANFLLVRFQDAEAVVHKAREAGILLRRFGRDSSLRDCLRITVGSAWEMRRLTQVLELLEAESDA